MILIWSCIQNFNLYVLRFHLAWVYIGSPLLILVDIDIVIFDQETKDEKLKKNDLTGTQAKKTYDRLTCLATVLQIWHDHLTSAYFILKHRNRFVVFYNSKATVMVSLRLTSTQAIFTMLAL